MDGRNSIKNQLKIKIIGIQTHVLNVSGLNIKVPGLPAPGTGERQVLPDRLKYSCPRSAFLQDDPESIWSLQNFYLPIQAGRP